MLTFQNCGLLCPSLNMVPDQWFISVNFKGYFSHPIFPSIWNYGLLKTELELNSSGENDVKMGEVKRNLNFKADKNPVYKCQYFCLCGCASCSISFSFPSHTYNMCSVRKSGRKKIRANSFAQPLSHPDAPQSKQRQARAWYDHEKEGVG